MFTLRRYTPADREAVEYLHVYAIRQAGAYLGRGPWDDDVYAIEESYLRNGGEFLVGEWDGHFVAMGALRRTSQERGRESRSPRVATASSTAKPGPSVASSRRTPQPSSSVDC